MNWQQEVPTTARRRRAEHYKRLPDSFALLGVPPWFVAKKREMAETQYKVLPKMNYADPRVAYLEVAKKTDLLRRVLSGPAYCTMEECKAAELLWNHPQFYNIVFNYQYHTHTTQICGINVYVVNNDPWLVNAIIESVPGVEVSNISEAEIDPSYYPYLGEQPRGGIHFTYKVDK